MWSQSILGKLKSPATKILQLSLRALDSDFEKSSQLQYLGRRGLQLTQDGLGPYVPLPLTASTPNSTDKSLNDSNLTQTVSISTRDSNILYLFFTTNPTFVQQVSILQGISNHGIVQIQVNTSTFAVKYLQPQNMLHLAFAHTTRQQLLNQTTSHCE